MNNLELIFGNSFTESRLKYVKNRLKLGLKPLNVEIREDFAKAGMIDGKPVYDTKEEAIAQAETLGCRGYHEHELEGKTVYMACETHDELMTFNKTDFSELMKFIEEYGEDIPEDWELIDEENVNDEHEEFDFEKELNSLVSDKLELASTGTARPNARSTQDGVNDSYNDYYKVRYVYTKDTSLTQIDSSREFCKLMMAAKKIYRKEDILQMTTMEVNKGWGPKGKSDTYSIWLWKGGGNCFHYWKRQIYKTSLRNAKANINSKQIISDAKAISEGFTLKRNSALVAKAPKTMRNEGFINR